MPVQASRTRAEPAPTLPVDPEWYKDAVIYQMHVRAFCDSSADGIGDFRGLTSKLDYIQDLGVTAIWIQPFFPSPLRDDGYDTANYLDVNPLYGTLRDFKAFLAEAKKRNLRVITEMVMNHTSDQHEWFQKSRRAKPGDPWRDFYVWSDNPKLYRDARIIFQDFEASNWTWDPVAHAYFWHRFYHHQPDLNFDNPAVRQAMLDTVAFWLELGVDGLRLDAVPYLYERDGTNCENLLETHAFLRELRAYIDARFPDKMLLAEANQWPEDAAAYFGDGDECHMNFHFPLMPRLFMAVEREDRFPVIDILEQTPQIPANCQWGIFLRNHDELTLEMVTDEERDYMYRAYASDPRARVNLGIRRRLAPLLRNNRRKIELMNALLLSLPGTPVIYYGDELGMGDNIYLGDRDGVRTPMQWNADRNAGFSRTNPQQLYLPPIIDAEYHYQALNVEVQQNSPHSLLWWMRRVIGTRKLIKAFGRGTTEFLTPDNPKVLAYLRQYEDETILVVANLSRFAQASEIDLSRFRGQVPVEMFGQTQFPPIGELPYFLTLGPYAFYWFRLQWPEGEIGSVGRELPSCTISGPWDNLFTGTSRAKFERALPAYLERQPWYGAMGRVLQSVELVDVLSVPGSEDAPFRLLVLRASFTEGEPDTYLLSVIFAPEERGANIIGDHPRAGILRVAQAEGESAVLCEAVWETDLWRALFDTIAGQETLSGRDGNVTGQPQDPQRPLNGKLDSATVFAEKLQNTTATLDGRYVLKLFRRLGSGEHPELELGRHLTEQKLECVPQLAGWLVYHPAGSELAGKRPNLSMTLGVLHEHVPNEGTAWNATLDELGRYLERMSSAPESWIPDVPHLKRVSVLSLAGKIPPDDAHAAIGAFLQAAEILGRRTAELHIALSTGTSPAFTPEPFTRLYQRSLYQSMRTRARQTLALLRRKLSVLPTEHRGAADRLLERENEILDRFHVLLTRPISAQRIRCHGDFHLGQVLFTGRDFSIIDFEGDPSHPVSERRIKRSPLRDVAGMIRSLHYAAREAEHAALTGPLPQHTEDVHRWMHFWYAWTAAAFLRTYLAFSGPHELLPRDRDELRILLDAYLLEKALYELAFELRDRPDHAVIAMEGIEQTLNAEG